MIYLIIYFIMIISSFYILHKIKNKNLCILKIILCSFFAASILFIFTIFDIRKLYITIIYYLIVFLISKIIYKLDTDKSVFFITLLYIINLVSDLIISLVVMCVKLNIYESLTHYLSSLIVCIIPIILINIRLIRNKIIYLLDNANAHKFSIILIILFSVFFLLVENITLKNSLLVIISLSFILIIILLLLKSIIAMQKLKDSNKRYNDQLKIINNYEKILDERIRLSHEYKNQLLIIKSMVNQKNKKIHTYLDKIFNSNDTNLDQILINEIQKIPFKTFNGLLYYKINEAVSDNINVNLEVSQKVKSIKNYNVNDKNIEDICKLLGIFMDNSIEASKDIKDKEISLSVYIDNMNNLIISIANKFNGITVSKNNKSTKGKWHGYGLEIAKDIIKKNKNIKNTTECISNVFIQNIILKLS